MTRNLLYTRGIRLGGFKDLGPTTDEEVRVEQRQRGQSTRGGGNRKQDKKYEQFFGE